MIIIHTIFRHRNASAAVLTPVLFVFMFLLLCRSDAASESVRNALSVCAKTILPSLFPFMILSNLMVKLGAADMLGRLFARPFRFLFGIDGGCAAAVLLGAVSGFPIGAKSALSIYQAGGCSKEDAEHTLAFCNNTGPAFVIAGIGGSFFKDIPFGVSLYIIHIASALTVGLVMRKKSGSKAPSFQSKTVDQNVTAADFTSSITDATSSVIGVCAFVIFFAVITDFIAEFASLLGLSHQICAVAAGFFEVTSGMRMTALIDGDISCRVIAAALLGWSGLSVHMQTLAITAGSGLSMKRYFLGKFLQSTMSAGIAWGYFTVISI